MKVIRITHKEFTDIERDLAQNAEYIEIPSTKKEKVMFRALFFDSHCLVPYENTIEVRKRFGEPAREVSVKIEHDD